MHKFTTTLTISDIYKSGQSSNNKETINCPNGEGFKLRTASFSSWVIEACQS
jgi:hypothetical protein